MTEDSAWCCAGRKPGLLSLGSAEENMQITFQFSIYRDAEGAPILPF
jgi:hypothetical protein